MQIKKPAILRKRYIPFETVDISKDEILYRSDELLITKWDVIRPRTDISKGVSYTFLKDGIKISRFYDTCGNFIYWYCDIIEVHYDENKDEFTLVDLLVDVKLTHKGELIVLDADELAEALEQGLITKDQACDSLRKLDGILKTVYQGSFPPEICKKQVFWI
ncbi:MAG: DUF402 domain-containing protein [Clostridia bacterium]|nr:DUF402 domain-containing protein [Clostridia bacterium]